MPRPYEPEAWEASQTVPVVAILLIAVPGGTHVSPEFESLKFKTVKNARLFSVTFSRKKKKGLFFRFSLEISRRCDVLVAEDRHRYGYSRAGAARMFMLTPFHHKF